MISPSNPYHLFAEVFAAARDTGMVEPNAMALATADADGCPTVRMVLLKDFDDDGFVFYTNLESRKSRQIQENPNAAICFYWQQIGRQVRAEGSVEPVSDAEADAYFASRAHGSQIGAWSSKQSKTLPDREDLLERVRATEERFAGTEVPRPPFWSGFRIRPRRIEFWTAGESRLHDRLVYEKEEGTDWRVRRLYP
ncbi:MAG: pyridoxamine 5'-phosphate oxidase [Candidatus Kapaibacterium sp.]